MMVKHDGNLVRAFGGSGALWFFCSGPHGVAHLGALLRTGIRFAGCTAQALVIANGGCALASFWTVWPYGSSF